MTTSFQRGLCEYFTPPSLWPRYAEMEAIVLIVWRLHGHVLNKSASVCECYGYSALVFALGLKYISGVLKFIQDLISAFV